MIFTNCNKCGRKNIPIEFECCPGCGEKLNSNSSEKYNSHIAVESILKKNDRIKKFAVIFTIITIGLFIFGTVYMHEIFEILGDSSYRSLDDIYEYMGYYIASVNGIIGIILYLATLISGGIATILFLKIKSDAEIIIISSFIDMTNNINAYFAKSHDIEIPDFVSDDYADRTYTEDK